jgi:hypothetical protein
MTPALDPVAALVAAWAGLGALRPDDAAQAEALSEAAAARGTSAARNEGFALAATASGSRRAGSHAGAEARAGAPAVRQDAAAGGDSPAGAQGDGEGAAASARGLERVASTAVSLAFLRDFYERCVAPLPGGEALTTKQVVDQVILPATKDSGACNFASLVPGAVGLPTAFASHAFGNPFSLLVAALQAHFAAAVASEVYVWVDVFAINQHPL